MGFKFIHIADVHLDTPFENKDINIRTRLRDKIRDSFRRAADAAIVNNVDALLIAGDLFDNDTLSFATEKFIIEQMEKLKDNGIKVFYASGNHDPSGIEYKISRIKWPENVFIFKKHEPEAVKLYNSDGSIKAVIVGAGHENAFEGRNLASLFPQGEKGIPYVGLLHASVTGKYGDKSLEKYAPCSLRDLTDKNYSYWALGHIHILDVLNEYPHVLYSGCPCGRNHKETGVKGAVLVDIDKEVKYSFLELSPVIWETVYADDIKDAKNFPELISLLNDTVSEKVKGNLYRDKYMIRIILSGPALLYKELQKEDNISAVEEELKYNLRIDEVEINADKVVKPVNPQEYIDEPHILGTALTLLKEIKSDSQLAYSLKPKRLAGLAANADSREVTEYMAKLLDGLDYELCERLLGGDEN